MQLDNQQQKEVILAAINATQWQGQVLEVVLAVKVAVVEATIVQVISPETSERGA